MPVPPLTVAVKLTALLTGLGLLLVACSPAIGTSLTETTTLLLALPRLFVAVTIAV